MRFWGVRYPITSDNPSRMQRSPCYKDVAHTHNNFDYKATKEKSFHDVAAYHCRLFSAVQFFAVGRIPRRPRKHGLCLRLLVTNEMIRTRDTMSIGGHQPREGSDNAGPSVFYEDDNLWRLSAGNRLIHFVPQALPTPFSTIADSEDCRPELLDVAALNESAVGCVQLENA